MNTLDQRLQEEFNFQKNNEGSHKVIDTSWQVVIEGYGELISTDELIQLLSNRPDINVLDEGCGSSLTLFECVESLENALNLKVNGYGLTASPEFLNRGAPEIIKSGVLKSETFKEEEKKRLRLLLNGINNDMNNGDHRYSPEGNLIKITKGDAHKLGEIYENINFDLIYSNAAYPHFLCPWLAFEQACNKLKEGGILLIDALPTYLLINNEGNKIMVHEYLEELKKINPGYLFKYTKDTLTIRIMVIKQTDDHLATSLDHSIKDGKVVSVVK